jgi:2-dehydropantoate 2-reductase
MFMFYESRTLPSEIHVDILVYGAGVIGTLYSARLQQAGHRVTVLARGERLVDIRRHGLVLEDIVGGTRSTTQIATTERLDVGDGYDIALVIVRRDQLAGIMPALTANHYIPTLLFMLNNPLGSTQLIRALGQDRVLLGFPGAGGTREGQIVRYAMIAQQPTTLGELSGRHGVTNVFLSRSIHQARPNRSVRRSSRKAWRAGMSS